MGNRFCCANQKSLESSPYYLQQRDTAARMEERRKNYLETLRNSPNSSGNLQIQTSYSMRGSKMQKSRDQCKDKFNLFDSFKHYFGCPIKFLSFSQRKFMGFRYQYEFDRKRILMASDQEFCIIGYDLDENPEELIRTKVSVKEKIQYIGFLDDERPQFVLMVTVHNTKDKTIIRLLKIRKEVDKPINELLNDLQSQRQIEKVVYQKIQQGELSDPKYSNDNYQCLLEQDLDFRKEVLKPYYKELMHEKKRKRFSLGDKLVIDEEPENYDVVHENKFGTQRINLLSNIEDDEWEENGREMEDRREDRGMSQEFNSRDLQFQIPYPHSTTVSQINETSYMNPQLTKSVFHLYEISEQILRSKELCQSHSFQSIFYFNYTLYKKILFGVTEKKLMMSYIVNHRQHLQANKQTPINKDKKNDRKASTDKNSNHEKGHGEGGASHSEPILINTHNTHYYGRVFNNNYHYKKIRVTSQIKHSDFIAEKLFVIYTDLPTYVDIFQVNGIQIARYNIEDCLEEHDLMLTKLEFIQIPMLKWSTRQAHIANFGQQKNPHDPAVNPAEVPTVKKILLAGKLFYQKKERSFLLVYNLEEAQAEMIKIIDMDSEINCVNYGPFDNGHILVGLKNGMLLVFEFPTLERIETVKLFDKQEITSITFDPTNFIFVGSSEGNMQALSCIEKKMNYLYLDLGKDRFCTVALPRSARNPVMGEEEDEEFENAFCNRNVYGNRMFCCV